MSVRKTKVKPAGPPVLRVISGGVEREVVPLAYVMKQLKRVLDAELEPGLTVEEACHIEVRYYETESDLRGLTAEVVSKHLLMLHYAGLACSTNWDDWPDAIVLEDAKNFKKKFPELAHVIPLLQAHCGVLPYTNGRPRSLRPLSKEEQPPWYSVPDVK